MSPLVTVRPADLPSASVNQVVPPERRAVLSTRPLPSNWVVVDPWDLSVPVTRPEASYSTVAPSEWRSVPAERPSRSYR